MLRLGAEAPEAQRVVFEGRVGLVSPFHICLHLARALEQSELLAQRFINLLSEFGVFNGIVEPPLNVRSAVRALSALSEEGAKLLSQALCVRPKAVHNRGHVVPIRRL